MKTNNEGVIDAWARGEEARNGNGSLWSDERGDLFSYNLHIGTRTVAGICIVGNYTRSGVYKSQTTSTHVNAAKRIAEQRGGVIMHPHAWEKTPMSRTADLPF